MALACVLLAVHGAPFAADSRGARRHVLQDSSAATAIPSAAVPAAGDAAAGDATTVVAPKWLSYCSADSTSSSWAMTLQHLQEQQAAVAKGGAQQCFVISRQAQCTVAASSPCCNPARGPNRVAVHIEPGLCSASLGRFSWSLDGQPIRFSLGPQGWLVSGRLGAWKPGQTTKQLCVQIAPAAAGSSDGCAALSDLCKGTSRCRYRLFSAAAVAAVSTAAAAASSSGCCMEGTTGDGSLFGGGTQSLSVSRAGSVNRLEDAFQGMAIAAEQLRTAVKEGDARAAAKALQIPATAANIVKRLAFARYAQGVIVAAEQPAAFDGTAFNTPVKSQGRSSMSASYAAIAVLEATVAARLSAGKPDGINLSEKALHWCDAAQPATPEAAANSSANNASAVTPTANGWHSAVAMATLAQYGAANASCYGDAVGAQYPIAELGNLQGSCEGALAGCSRLKGFRYIDLTPKTDPSRYTAVLEHIQKHHAVAARLQVTEEMLQQLTGLQQSGGMLIGAAAAAGDLVVEDLDSTSSQNSFGHVVAVVGYNFSSSDASQHYWLIKDSLPGVGAGQYWKLAVKSAVGMGAWIGGFSFTPRTGPDSVTLDPVLSSPRPVDPAGTVKPTPINASPSPEPALNTSQVADSAAAADLAVPLAAPGGQEAATAALQAEGGIAGNTAGASGAAATGMFQAPIIDPNRQHSSKHPDIDPDDLVLLPEDRTRPSRLSLMSVSLAELLGNSVAASASSSGAARPADCSTYTTNVACERLSVIWHSMGGAAAGLRPLVGVLADNFEALSGKDITCLAAGTQLKMCRR